MKKSIAVFVSLLTLGGCTCTADGSIFGDCALSKKMKEDAARQENTYKIDTPYGLENFSNETIAPEIYTIVATRTVNKMLDSTHKMYENKSDNFVYVMEPKIEDDLPNGFYLSQDVTKKIIDSSRTFTVVNNLNDATYYTETLIKKIQIEGKDAPIIQYKLMLFDKQNNKLDEWSETIRQVENDDRSWW